MLVFRLVTLSPFLLTFIVYIAVFCVSVAQLHFVLFIQLRDVAIISGDLQ